MDTKKVATGRAPDGTAFDVYGNGEPVFLIHGVGLDRSVWVEQLAALSVTHHQIIVYDTLGHGASRLPPEDASLSHYSQQLLSLMDHLRVPVANIVGHSMGALIALDFAINHPSRALRVAAISGVFSRSKQAKENVLARALRLRSSSQHDFADATISRWFGDPVSPCFQDATTKIRTIFSKLDPVGYARAYQTFATSDSINAHRFNELTMPSLFITGELDHNSTPAMSRAMAERAPRARLEILGNAGHMITMTHAKYVNEALIAFLGLPVERSVRASI